MRTLRLVKLLPWATAFAVGCAPTDPPADTKSGDAPAASTAKAEPVAPPPLVISGANDRPADPRRTRLEAAIAQAKRRDLRTDNGFWTVFHAILGLGPKSVTLLNPETGERVNALDYVARGGEVRGLKFLPTPHGLDVQVGPQWVGQGHQDQFVAEMTQWGVAADRPFVVNGTNYTFLDFVRHAKMRASVRQKQELSWAVLIVGEHFGTEGAWTNQFGEEVRFEDLVRYELDQPMDGTTACGGTHRLFGLTWVQHLHQRKGGALTGVWKDVADNTEKYKTLAKLYQNADGSFSTNFFRERGDVNDRQLRMNTTGHTLEWLALALSDAELKEEWVERAADRLALMFHEIQGSPMESGSLYHATHGLLIYYARVYGKAGLGDLAPPVPPPPGSK